jgi:hypothetical protein
MPGHHPRVMPHQHSFHISKRWSIIDGQGSTRFVNNIGFSEDDDRWSMVDDRASTRFMGTFGLQEKNDRWSMVDDRASGDRWEGLVHKGNHHPRSLITDRKNINGP